MDAREFRHLHDRTGLTQAGVAARLGVSQHAVSFWRRGQRRIPSEAADRLRALANLATTEAPMHTKQELGEIVVSPEAADAIEWGGYGLEHLLDHHRDHDHDHGACKFGAQRVVTMLINDLTGEVLKVATEADLSKTTVTLTSNEALQEEVAEEARRHLLGLFDER